MAANKDDGSVKKEVSVDASKGSVPHNDIYSYARIFSENVAKAVGSIYRRTHPNLPAQSTPMVIGVSVSQSQESWNVRQAGWSSRQRTFSSRVVLVPPGAGGFMADAVLYNVLGSCKLNPWNACPASAVDCGETPALPAGEDAYATSLALRRRGKEQSLV
jgi:hypothetical protein